ncbi:MAG: cytochrome c biogenesis protein CcsA, partial [Saprospiraceae bacterium]|nr:cytochrome c biogenesis protein CcsA [Saprospiraceae bacterium]
MKKNWWKILGVALMVYAFVAGLLIPLKPGLIGVEPTILEAGKQVTLNVEGYNTFLQSQKKDLNAWLVRKDGKLLKPVSMEVQSETNLSVSFQLPKKETPADVIDTLQLVVDNPADGHFIRNVFVKQGADSITTAATWSAENVELHENHGFSYPFLINNYESSRNLFYHVPMWFSMFIIAIAAAIISALYLFKRDSKHDLMAEALSKVAMLLGLLGLVTGAVWARNTWGQYWSNDPKQVYTAIGLLIYGGYFVLRSSFEDPEKRARISAAYNIFAISSLFPLLYILPKFATES